MNGVFVEDKIHLNLHLNLHHVTLLCGIFLFVYLSEGPVHFSDCPIDTPMLHPAGLSIHTGLVHQCCALIPPPEADQHQSEISPLATSDTFTQRRRQRIGAGSPH